jgi:chromosome segregation ATPase
VPPPPPPAPEGDAAGCSPPPVIRRSSDLAAASEWLQRERARMDGYTKSQLERLQKEHQALLSQNYRNEQALIEKIQELGRKEEFLNRQHRELQTQLQARLQAAEQAETAGRRREAEFDETEARLLQELEGQRRRMAEQQAALDERAAQLAERAAHLDELESVLAGVQDELNLRVQELDARERNLSRREEACRPRPGRPGRGV